MTVKPYTGVEEFVFTSASRLKHIRFLGLMFLFVIVFLAVTALIENDRLTQQSGTSSVLALIATAGAVGVAFLAIHIYTSALSSRSLVRLDWDESTIELENPVLSRAGLWPRKTSRYVKHPLNEIEGYGIGGPIFLVDTFRKRSGTPWTYLVVRGEKYYLHENLEDHHILMARMKERLGGKEPETFRDLARRTPVPAALVYLTAGVGIVIVSSLVFLIMKYINE